MNVSLCIIAYNEEKALPALLEDVKRQDYPHEKMEIVLVNSMSRDGTEACMEAFKEQARDFARVQVLLNRGRSQASGWNTAIKAASGDVIVRVDAHASIPADFVRQNVAVLESGEMVCGGPRPAITPDDEPWKKTLLLAENSMFGSSIAPYRNEGNGGKKYVRSLFHGAYRREVFEDVGGFNEYLGRTEDNELHYRIRKAGYKICYCPDIHSCQHSRSSLRRMVRQKYGNGYWIGLTAGVCPECLSLYHFVPFGFVCGILVTTALALKKHTALAKLMWGAYGALCGVMSLFAVKHEKKHISQLLLPVLFPILHISYGVGTLAGLIRMPAWRKTHQTCPSVLEVKRVLLKKKAGKPETEA